MALSGWEVDEHGWLKKKTLNPFCHSSPLSSTLSDWNILGSQSLGDNVCPWILMACDFSRLCIMSL